MQTFLNLADHDIVTVVRWYELVGQVAAAHGLYVHLFERFRRTLMALLALLMVTTTSIVLIHE